MISELWKRFKAGEIFGYRLNPDALAHYTNLELEVQKNVDHPPMVWKAWERNSWGDSIDVQSWEERSIVGWTTPLPKKGDEVQFKMKSGKIGRCRIDDITYCGDPSDMWFARLSDLGYVN